MYVKYLEYYTLTTCSSKCDSIHDIECLKKYKNAVENAIETFDGESWPGDIAPYTRNFPMNVCKYGGYHQTLADPVPGCSCVSQMKWELEQINSYMEHYYKEKE